MEATIVQTLRERLGIIGAAIDKARREIDQLEEDRKAVERTIAILNGTQFAQSGNHDIGISAADLRGLTQLEAVTRIARANGGQLSFTPTRHLLLDAGLIRNPKNAASILNTLLARSEHFRRVGRGEYALVKDETDVPVDPDIGPVREALGEEVDRNLTG